MPDELITYVAVCPAAELEPRSLERIAPLLHKDPNATRRLLSGEIPRLAAHFATFREAESLALQLKAEGLNVFLCPETELRAPCTTFNAYRLSPGEGQVVFGSRNGKTLILKPGEVFLIIKGVKNTRLEHEETKVTSKLNLAATLMTGGIPLFKKVTKTTTVSETTSERFIRLYDRKSAQPLVEIRQRNFDYSFLGSKLGLSSLANIDLTALELHRLFPRAALDDRLVHPVVNETASPTGWDVNEVNCRLVYMSV